MKAAKQGLCILAAFILTVSVLAGCSGDKNAENEGMKDGNKDMPAIEEGLEGGMPAGEMGDIPPEGTANENGAGDGSGDKEAILSENQTQIAGKVTAIVGNEVTLKLLNDTNIRASGDSTKTSPRQKQSAGNTNSGEVPPSPDIASDELPASNSSEDTSAAAGKDSEASDGNETKTLLIPVGLTLSGGTSSSTRSKDFSSISEGMLLLITLENAGKEDETVVAVHISSNS